MGSWQERIRQVQEREIREQAQRKVYEEEKTRESIESAETEKKDAIAETNLLKEEFFPLMERLGARELLRQVRDEVWRVGEIDPEPEVKHHDTGANRNDDSCSLGLSFDYETAYEAIVSHSSSAQQDYGIGTHNYGWKRGIAKTTLKIIIKRSFTIPLEEGRRVESRAGRLKYRQGFQGKSYGYNWEFSLNGRFGFEAGDFDPLNPENSRIKLEEFILKDCVERTKGKTLPLQLKEQGEMEISKHFPIQSFVKRFFGGRK